MIIGFTGKKQHGKDTSAKLFAMGLPAMPFKRLAFADELKREVCNALQIDPEFLALHKEQFRPLLQAWGTMRRNLYGQEYWVNHLANEYLHLVKNENLNFAITDVRYNNEAFWIKKNGGIVVRIFRTGYGQFDPHISENELEHYTCDYTIHAKTLLELQHGILNLTENLQLTESNGPEQVS